MIEISKIEEILPQTQCRQCGYHDCADYAKAIAVGEKHNRCPAGGPQVISRLSVLLGREELPLNEECGIHVPPEIAEIDPNKCIGCGSCIYQCPFGAIMDKSYIVDAVQMLKGAEKWGYRVYAVVAPSIAGQFAPPPWARWPRG